MLAFPIIGAELRATITLAPLRRGFFCVPSMIDSLEVEVLYPA